MAESACFLRSFSNPTDTSSCAAVEVDPLRFLGESISFGRYMSESLDWEKYSTFSHKRYVEEAEKFSKPGSVAEKKAYFEAHYKKKAAQRAADLLQEANASVNETMDSETQDGNCNNSSIETNSKENSDVTVVEQPEKDAVDYQLVDYAEKNNDKCDTEQSQVGISRVGTPEDVPQLLVHTNLKVENSVLVDNSSQLDNDDKVIVPQEERMHDPGNLEQVKRRELESSATSATKATTSKPSRSLAERKAKVQNRSLISGAPKSQKSVGGLVEKKKLSATSLHMSINLTSCAGETSKTVSVLQQNRMKRIISKLPNISRDRPIASQTSARASYAVFNQASANPQSKDGRTERRFNMSVSGGVTASAKLSSLSVKCTKSLSSSSPQSSTITSPFRFKSEERAAKRKEFFQRMDEIKSKEAEKVQLRRRCKEKTEHDHKKLQQSYGFKAKLNEDMNSGQQLRSNEMRKTSFTQPQSPKTGRKATSSTCYGKNSRNSSKPPISNNTSKRVTEKISQTTRRSVTSLSKKITQENVAPNIQR